MSRVEQRANREEFALEQRLNKGIELRTNSEVSQNEPRANYENRVVEARTKPERFTNEQLVERIKAEENVAENMLQLWQQNKGMIYQVVNRYRGVDEMEDLLQEAFLGLYEAVRHYDSEQGTAFVSYMTLWVRQTVSRYIKSNGCVRIPEHVQNFLWKYKKMENKWLTEFGRKPNDWEICRYLDVTWDNLQQLKVDAQKTTIGSLDVPVGEEEDCSLYDIVPDENNRQEDALERIYQEQLKTVLWQLVETLPEQQPEVIKLRFLEGKTLKETGERIGCGINQARTIEAKALRTLRQPSKSNVIKAYLPEYAEAAAYYGSSVGTFNRTWTSSTERVALELM